MSRLVEVNQATLIGIMLYDSASNQFPRARVYNAAGTEQSGSPFNLTHVANGYYSNNSWTPTVEGIYFVAIRIFSDAGYTTLSPRYENWGETVEVRSVDQDLATVLARIGTPVGTLASDIAGIQTKLGTPAGVSVSADIAAVKSDTGTILGQTGTTGVQIANGAITNAKFAANAIDANAIADNAIDAGAIAAGAITSAKFAAGAIDANAIADNAIDAGAIATGAITAAKFAANAIDANAIADNAIDAGAIAAGAITAAKFANNAITAAALASDAAVEIAAAVWDEPLASHVAAGSMGFNQNLLDDIEADTASLNDVKITTARANNLDNLDTTISSRASQASVDAIQNNTRFAMIVQSPLILPTTGSVGYKFFGRLYDEIGNPEDPDSNTINIRIETPGGTVVVATTAMTRTAVGRYEYLYTVNSTDTERPLVVFMEYAENSVSFQQVRTTEVQEFETKLDTLLSRLTATRANLMDNLVNLDATVSSRQSAATALSQYNAIQADTDDIQTKIGTPVGTLASDIAGVQTTVNTINSKLGTPAGASVSADIAAVKSDTSTLTSRLTATRAGYLDNLPNLDATVSSRQDAATALTQYNSIISDIAGVQTKLGTPAGASVSADIAAVKSDTASILTQTGTTGVAVSASARALIVDEVWDELQSAHTTLGTFGSLLDATVSSRQSAATALSQFNSIQSSVAGVQSDTDDIQAKIGTPVGTLASDIAAIASQQGLDSAAIAGIKATTDQLTFTGSNVNANTQVNSDKTDYTLTSLEKDDIVDRVWDEQLSGHTTAGSAGKTLADIGTTASPAAIAAAVWDQGVAAHTTPNTFGNYVQVIRQTGFAALGELTSVTHGLAAIYAQDGNNTLQIVSEINQNETKIDAIIPYVASQTTLLKGEIDQNQILIEALGTQLSGTESTIMAELGVVENKVDAVAAEIGTIQNNTTVRFVVPERLIKPASGSKTYQFHLRLYDETGHAQAPDSTPTIRIRRLDTGVDVVAGAAMTPDGVKVGAYYYNFTITAGTDEYQALVEATVIENGATRYVPAVTEITEFESDLNSIQAQLTSVQSTVVNTNTAVNSGVYGLAALKSGQTNIVAEIDQNQLLIQAVKSKTDLLPASPASTGDVAAVNTTVLTRPTLADITTQINLARDYIVGPDNRNITAVYDKIDFTGIMQSNDPRLNYLDANVSSRSTLTAANVWSFGTRELTNFSLPVASIKGIWDYLASQAITAGSLGKLLADNLDAKVSTRATAAQVTAALAGVAQESTVSSLAGLITTGDNQTQIQLAAVATDVSQIKAKTQNLPSDPVSASVVTGGFSTQATALANLDLKTTGIKAKTDNLPPDPAKETSVQARPINPALASDIRLTRLDVAVSTRGTLQPADLAGLATAAGLASTQTALTTEINQNEAKIDNVQATANFIKAKTDNLPAQPVSKQQLDAAVIEIINEIDTECSGGGGSGITAADVWSFPNRTITQDPQSFGPDISDLATKEDVENITVNTNSCRMSTTLNSTDNMHEVIVWLEKNGVPFAAASNARVKVMTTEGNEVWSAVAATPNLDGVFSFIMSAMPPDADRSYYVEMIISDGTTDHVGRAAFITVG